MGHENLSFCPPLFFVYYKETKRELERVLLHECLCNERLKAEVEGSTRLVYTGLSWGLEHPKIETDKRREV